MRRTSYISLLLFYMLAQAGVCLCESTCCPGISSILQKAPAAKCGCCSGSSENEAENEPVDCNCNDCELKTIPSIPPAAPIELPVADEGPRIQALMPLSEITSIKPARASELVRPPDPPTYLLFEVLRT